MFRVIFQSCGILGVMVFSYIGTAAGLHEKIWELDTKNTVMYTPAMAPDGTIYFAAAIDKLYAVDGLTGQQKWATPLQESIGMPALGFDGTLYAGTSSGTLFAFDSATGTQKSRFRGPFPARHASAPAISTTGIIYYPTGKALFALDPSSGTAKWRFDGPAALAKPVIGLKNTIHVTALREFYALNGETGEVVWNIQFEGDSNGVAPGIGADGTIYVGTTEKKLYALAGDTGQVLWEFKANGAFISSPVVGSDGSIYVISADSYLYCLDGGTGIEKWAYPGFFGYLPTTVGVPSPCISASGVLFGGSLNGNFYALDAKTGTKIWDFGQLKNVASPILSPDGVLYVASLDKKLIAFQEESGLAESSWPRDRGDIRGTASFEPKGPPVIISRPPDRLVAQNDTVNIGAVVGGSKPMFFQWYFNGTPISGATNSQFRIANTTLSDEGSYSVVASNEFGVAESSVGTLQIGYRLTTRTVGPGLIKRHPEDEILLSGSTVKLTAVANANRKFSHWDGHINSEAESVSVILTNHLEINAFFKAHTGDLLWKFQTENRIDLASPAISDHGIVYLGSTDGKMYALDEATGAKRWEFSAGPIHSSAAIGPDNTLFFLAQNTLIALDGFTGTKKWDFFEGNGNWSIRSLGSPAIGPDGTVFFGSLNGKLFALDGTTGSKKWELQTSVIYNGFGIEGSPAIGSDGIVYIGSEDGFLYALHGSNGVIKWKIQTGHKMFSSPSLDDNGTLYCGVGPSLVAFDVISGSNKWVFPAEQGVNSSPIIGLNRTVFVSSDSGNFYAVDSITGKQKWAYQLADTSGGQWFGSATVGADRIVYIAGPEGFREQTFMWRLLAIDSEEGQLEWHFSVPGGVNSSPTLSNSGVLYLGAGDGAIYAIKCSSGVAKSPWPKFRGNLKNTGYNPKNVRSPIILNADFSGLDKEILSIHIHGEPGDQYILESTLDLKSWLKHSVLTNVIGDLEVKDSKDAQQRYYRVRAVTP